MAHSPAHGKEGLGRWASVLGCQSCLGRCQVHWGILCRGYLSYHRWRLEPPISILPIPPWETIARNRSESPQERETQPETKVRKTGEMVGGTKVAFNIFRHARFGVVTRAEKEEQMRAKALEVWRSMIWKKTLGIRDRKAMGVREHFNRRSS